MDNHRPGLGEGPFYFGSATQPLYGYYHAPLNAEIRRCGVVLCAPPGYEYISSHRALRQLAVQLSSIGFPVLRFDFSGCGDSSGEFEQRRFAHWLDDIATAIEEMKVRSGLGTLCLIGLRLGGTLAVLASRQSSAITHLVLWEPIVNGQAYLTRSRKAVAYRLAESRSAMLGENYLEFHGFLYTKWLLEDILTTDLLAITDMKAQQILCIENAKNADTIALMQHLQRGGMAMDYQYIPSFTDWLNKPNRVLVPAPILTAITSWIAQVVS